MTTIMLEKRVCANCGCENEFGILYSTNTFGAPDLDLRPAEMERSTMSSWVQQCSDCGYCNHDVSQFTENAADIVGSSEYRRLRADDAVPSLARSFLLLALLNESDSRTSARARLHAAWVCDDAGLETLASDFRTMAINDMRSHWPFSDSEEGLAEGLVYVDMLRRTKRFGDAVDTIDTLLSYRQAEDILEQALRYERELCQEENAESKTIADASAA